MLFDNDPDPTENSFFETETPYQKLVLRQAMDMDLHVYQLLSGRAMLDFSTVVAYMEQDLRVVGNEAKRVDMLHVNATSQMMQLHSHVPAAVDDMRDLDPILQALDKRDKTGRRNNPVITLALERGAGGSRSGFFSGRVFHLDSPYRRLSVLGQPQDGGSLPLLIRVEMSAHLRLEVGLCELV